MCNILCTDCGCTPNQPAHVLSETGLWLHDVRSYITTLSDTHNCFEPDDDKNSSITCRVYDILKQEIPQPGRCKRDVHIPASFWLADMSCRDLEAEAQTKFPCWLRVNSMLFKETGRLDRQSLHAIYAPCFTDASVYNVTEKCRNVYIYIYIYILQERFGWSAFKYITMKAFTGTILSTACTK